MESNEDFVVDGEGSGVLTVDLEAGSVTEMEPSDDSNVINLLSGCEDGAVARKTHETICLEDESFIEDPSTLESQALVAMDVLSIMAGMDKDDPSFVLECFYEAISSVKGLAIEDVMKRLFLVKHTRRTVQFSTRCLSFLLEDHARKCLCLLLIVC